MDAPGWDALVTESLRSGIALREHLVRALFGYLLTSSSLRRCLGAVHSYFVPRIRVLANETFDAAENTGPGGGEIERPEDIEECCSEGDDGDRRMGRASRVIGSRTLRQARVGGGAAGRGAGIEAANKFDVLAFRRALGAELEAVNRLARTVEVRESLEDTSTGRL